MPNPVQDFIDANKKRNEARTEQTQQLWHTWNSNGRTPEHLEPLLDNFSGLIGSKVKEWKPALYVPTSAFEAQLSKHVIKAIETYNPERGANLNTHVNVRIKKALRYMAQQQNMARIPEKKTWQISSINRARNELEEDLGRDPTHAEIATHLGMPEKTVKAIIGAQRADIPASSFESDPTPRDMIREQEILPLVRNTLPPREQLVFDHLHGYNGAKTFKTKAQMAAHLGMSPSVVSRIITSVTNKYKEAI
jgi:AraC-like DNA-binding protein